MRFSHIRDKNGNLRATIAYEKLNESTAAYGVTLVSYTEPESRVSLKTGRAKAAARCAKATSGEVSGWKCYDGNKVRSNTWRNNYHEKLCSLGVQKLGSLDIDHLKETIAELRRVNV